MESLRNVLGKMFQQLRVPTNTMSLYVDPTLHPLSRGNRSTHTHPLVLLVTSCPTSTLRPRKIQSTRCPVTCCTLCQTLKCVCVYAWMTLPTPPRLTLSQSVGQSGQRGARCSEACAVSILIPPSFRGNFSSGWHFVCLRRKLNRGFLLTTLHSLNRGGF